MKKREILQTTKKPLNTRFIKTLKHFEIFPVSFNLMAERVGFEPTVPFGITGFQDQLLKPLGHLSISCYISIASFFIVVNY